MPEVTTCAFDVWRALFRLLDAARWPAPPSNTSAAPFRMYLGMFVRADVPKGEPLEGGLVVTQTEVAEQDWATYGQLKREENFVTRVQIGTALRNRTVDQVLDRLEELSEVVGTMLRDTVRPGTQPVELVGRMNWWELASVEPRVVVAQHGGPVGVAECRIAVNARF